jgi:hypothetical protein
VNLQLPFDQVKEIRERERELERGIERERER